MDEQPDRIECRMRLLCKNCGHTDDDHNDYKECLILIRMWMEGPQFCPCKEFVADI